LLQVTDVSAPKFSLNLELEIDICSFPFLFRLNIHFWNHYLCRFWSSKIRCLWFGFQITFSIIIVGYTRKLNFKVCCFCFILHMQIYLFFTLLIAWFIYLLLSYASIYPWLWEVVSLPCKYSSFLFTYGTNTCTVLSTT
jgi:hypothetical protein